jgi:amino acid adenylation domain-containing protein
LALIKEEEGMKSRSREISTSTAFAASQYGEEKEYWLKKLAGELVKSSFPYDINPFGRFSKRKDPVKFGFSHRLFSTLMSLSTGLDHRLYIILTAAAITLIHKYSGNKDILVGVPIYRQESRGEFLNTVLVLRTQPEEAMSFKELILQVRQTMVEATQNQNYPVKTLMYQLDIPESGTENESPLFDISILLENIHEKAYLQTVNHNMIFSFKRTGEFIEGTLEYNPLRYHKNTIARIIKHYTRLLEKVSVNLDIEISRIEILTGEEKKQLLVDFNNTRTPYPKEKTIDEVFEEQAAKTPGKPALIYEAESLNYNRLNQRADRVAAYLRHKGVSADEAVGIIAGPSLEMVVGILGILKAGGAYLPLNPDYPEKRKKYLLKDGKARILLTNCEETGQYSQEVILLNDPDIYNSRRKSKIKRIHKYNNLSYIMHTSGSTGKPKGIMVGHRNVIRLVINTNYIEFREDDRILQTGALEFDASTFEIWGALLNGLVLCLTAKESILTEQKLKETIEKHRVTTMWMTSTLFNHVLDADIDVFPGLRNLLVGGDVLSISHINRLKNRHPHLNVINGYGPTENTTFSTTLTIDKEYKESIPIGKPISNTFAYIVNNYNHLVPIGVLGELCVGGDGVARGYLNMPELTAEKFIEEVTGAGHRCRRQKIYRTGDLARWLPDGRIEFCGRLDHQVKIRGYRIELGDIETRLLSHDEIKDAVVTAKETGAEEKALCAYIVSRDAAREFTVIELREYISKQLPGYMLPTYFVQMEELPLTIGGKVDRKSLPNPKDMIDTGKTYEAPTNETEKKILQIWAEVLGLDADKIGVTDNFFELGGNSISILKIQSRLNKQFDRDISMSTMFLYPTIRELAANIPEEPLINKLENIVKLNKGGNEKNIFIFHPMHGMTYPYKELAELLENHYNVYGIQSKGLVRESPLPGTYEEMLQEYIPQVKAIQKTGPYILAGFCLGAVLAYEAARELEDEGEPIEKLIMLDIHAFIPEVTIRFYPLKRALYLTRHLIPRLLRKKIRQDPEEPPVDEQERLTQRVETNNKAVSMKFRYKRIINSPILHIRARENHLRGLTKEYWSKMTGGRVDCFETPGNHDTMLAHPHVKELAEIIKSRVNFW